MAQKDEFILISHTMLTSEVETAWEKRVIFAVLTNLLHVCS